MAQRVNEDIRFYLPADPYYYQVDNLPLEDLLSNDVRLQSQIDEINSSDRGNTVGRAGFTELQPFIDAGIPGTVSVRPGNFIGRVQRSNNGGFNGNAGSRYSIYDGRVEMNVPPTTFGSGDNPTGTYSVNNPSNSPAELGDGIGRNAVINFKGGNITIDSFDFNEFQGDFLTTAPLGRLDLIGVGTMNGAMDDPYLPGNPIADGVLTGDGYANLSVVKGAGIVSENNGKRVVTIGEKYITVGAPQELLNDYARNLEGDVVPNPEFGTVPMPDDVVNVNFARDLMGDGEIAQSINDLGLSNKNANFFLPLAYVFVPQSHVEGNPIPEQYMRDIRPFFRTAELSLPERQAVVGAISPSLNNPFVTESHAKAITVPITDTLNQEILDLTSRVIELESMKGKSYRYLAPALASNRSNSTFLPAGSYIMNCMVQLNDTQREDGRVRIGIHKGGNYGGGNTTPNVVSITTVVRTDADQFATMSLAFTLTDSAEVQIAIPRSGNSEFDAFLRADSNNVVGYYVAVSGPTGFSD